MNICYYVFWKTWYEELTWIAAVQWCIPSLDGISQGKRCRQDVSNCDLHGVNLWTDDWLSEGILTKLYATTYKLLDHITKYVQHSYRQTKVPISNSE